MKRHFKLIGIITLLFGLAWIVNWIIEVDREMPEKHMTNPSFNYAPR